MSGKVLPARRELFALHSPGWRLKGSRSSGWSRTRAVYCHPAGRSSRSRVNIVVLALPYKHKQQDGLCAAAVCSRGKCEIGPKDRKSGLPVLLSEVEASLDFFSDKEISSLLQTSNVYICGIFEPFWRVQCPEFLVRSRETDFSCSRRRPSRLFQ